MSALPALLLTWLVCLVWTLAFELPIASALLRRAVPHGASRPVVVALVANLITHPLVWGTAHCWPTPSVAAGAELFAVGIEAVAYARWLGAPWPVALGVSFIANGASLGACLFAPMP